MAKSSSTSKSTPSRKPTAKTPARKAAASKAAAPKASTPKRSTSTKSAATTGKANSVAKKPAAKKTAAAKPAAKKPAAKKPAATKPAAKATKAAKPAAKSTTKPAARSANNAASKPTAEQKPVKMTKFLVKQQARLLELKDGLLDSMNGVARDTLRHRAEGNEASAFGMHQADAGSDAYDRDFALNLLSQEQDALYEIDEALKRIEGGTYGVCEMSGKSIPHPRLEALPFTRFTVECQAEIERRNQFQRHRQPVTSLFGLGDDDAPERDSDNDSNE